MSDPKPTLAASQGNTNSAITGADPNSTQAQLEAEIGNVEFTLTSTVELKSAQLTKPSDPSFSQAMVVDPGDKKKATLTIPVQGSQDFGVYGASAVGTDDQPIEVKSTVELVARGAGPSGPSGGNGSNNENNPVAEVAIGVYDPVFTFWVFLLVVGLSVASVAALVKFFGSFQLPFGSGKVVDAGKFVDGSFPQQVAAVVLLIGICIGTVTLLLGAGLAALETRGRLQLREGKNQDSATRDATVLSDPAQLEHLAKLVEAFGKVRGTIATVVTGGLLVALAMWFAMLIATAGTAPAKESNPKPSASPTVSATPTAPPANSPEPTGSSQPTTPPASTPSGTATGDG